MYRRLVQSGAALNADRTVYGTSRRVLALSSRILRSTTRLLNIFCGHSRTVRIYWPVSKGDPIMSRDDLTRDMANANEDDKETQSTITAVFRLLQGVESRLNAKLDAITARLDEVESRLTRDIAGVNTRVTEGFKELTHKTNALNRRALQQEADYEDLFDRIGRLESKT